MVADHRGPDQKLGKVSSVNGPLVSRQKADSGSVTKKR